MNNKYFDFLENNFFDLEKIKELNLFNEKINKNIKGNQIVNNYSSNNEEEYDEEEYDDEEYDDEEEEEDEEDAIIVSDNAKSLKNFLDIINNRNDKSKGSKLLKDRNKSKGPQENKKKFKALENKTKSKGPEGNKKKFKAIEDKTKSKDPEGKSLKAIEDKTNKEKSPEETKKKGLENSTFKKNKYDLNEIRANDYEYINIFENLNDGNEESIEKITVEFSKNILKKIRDIFNLDTNNFQYTKYVGYLSFLFLKEIQPLVKVDYFRVLEISSESEYDAFIRQKNKDMIEYNAKKYIYETLNNVIKEFYSKDKKDSIDSSTNKKVKKNKVKVKSKGKRK